jgi:ribonuclease HI
MSRGIDFFSNLWYNRFMSEFVLNFDGSCGPTNPGPSAGWGYIIKKDGMLFCVNSGELSGKTFSNNYAEFHALYEGLKFLKEHVTIADKLFIRGDSQLVIKIIRGSWRAKNGIYYTAYVLASEALTDIRRKRIPVSIDWVPREMNTQADELSTKYSSTSGEKR